MGKILKQNKEYLLVHLSENSQNIFQSSKLLGDCGHSIEIIAPCSLGEPVCVKGRNFQALGPDVGSNPSPMSFCLDNFR